MKRVSILVLVLMVFLSSTVVFGNVETGEETYDLQMENEISLILNGEPLEFDTPPKIVDGRTLVPVRKILEALGTEVSWVSEEQKVVAQNVDQTINMWIDKKEMVLNDESITIDVAPMIINGRTYIPVRAVSELLDSVVYWDGTNRTVLIVNKEINEVAKKLEPVLNKSNFQSTFDLTSSMSITNDELPLLNGFFDLYFENSALTIEELASNLNLELDLGYETYTNIDEIREFLNISGSVSTKELENDMISLDLAFDINENGMEQNFTTSYPVSKDDLSFEEIESDTTSLLNVYLAPYIDITTEGEDTIYTIDSNGPLKDFYSEELLDGEELVFNLSFIDSLSDNKLDVIEFVLDSKLSVDNSFFVDMPVDYTNITSNYNDLNVNLTILMK